LHCGKAIDATAAGEPQKKRLSLVFQRVRDMERPDAVRMTPVPHKPVAGRPGSVFDVGRRFPSAPDKDMGFQPQGLGPHENLVGNPAGIRHKPMIDGEDNGFLASRLTSPVCGQEHERG
jgi:hypothetical protein